MKKWILILFVIGFNSGINSQVNFEECLPENEGAILKSGGNICSDNKPNNNSSLYRNKYAKMEHWIPEENDEKLTVRIAFHIFNDDQGGGTNYPENQSTIDDVYQMVSWVNSFYNNCEPSNPIQGVDDIDFTKIKFDVDNRIFFYKSNSLNGSCNQTQKMNYIKQYFPERSVYLPIFISGECGQYASLPYPDFIPETGGGTSLDLEGDSYIVMSGIGWGGSQTLGHELGHTLDLKHTYEVSCCHESCDQNSFDYLWDVFGTSVNNQCWHDGGWDCDINDVNNTCTNNMMGGVNTACHYFSPLQVGKMQRALSLKSVRKYVDPKSKIKRPYHVTSTEVWDFDIRMHRDIIIDAGAELTLSCRVRMGDSCKVVVMPGGKLIIDGGIITNALYSDDFWQGIQVYGTTNKNQFPENNPTYQGLLIVKNGGTIENAHLAASNWKVDDYNSIGGVIQTNNAIFRNNRRDVAFMNYQNYNPNYSNKYRNLSKFTNTEFITDDAFIERGLTIQPHVTMWKVDGITFSNCHFSNEISTNKDDSSAPDQAIYSIDAGYTVSARCSQTLPIGQQCPTASLLKSRFEGFKTAIEALGSVDAQGTLTVQQSEFINNNRGIVIEEFDNVSINRNDIEIGRAGYIFPFIFSGTGIMVDNSTGFIIEENDISAGTSGFMSGIYISNDDEDNDNRLYKNKVEGLLSGASASGVNHNSNYQKGLQFLCNEFTDNNFGILIGSSTITDGVRFYQGDYSPEKSAGNVFVNNSSDITNNANSIVYFHNGGTTEPINYQGLVSLQYTSTANSCPTSFGGGIIMFPFETLLDSLNTELDDLTSSYTNLNFTYQSLIDDGNTEGFKEDIELNWSNDAWLLRSKLLESSPYLSSEVLLKSAEQNILPNGMLLEILLANPEATRGEQFIEKLNEVTTQSLPEYMLDYVRNNWDYRTIRANMESQLAVIHSDLSNVVSWIQYITQSKEEYDDEERLEALKLGGGIYQKINVMDYYISKNEFNKADSILTVIENDDNFKNHLPLISDYSDYITFHSDLGDRNLAQLDSSEIDYLQTLAEHEGRVAGYAQNILCFFYNICYEKELYFGETEQRLSMIVNNKQELNDVLYNVKLYPNPANDYTSIVWEIYDELKDATYRVVDLNGREQLNGTLTDNKGEQVLDTRKLKNGVYIIGIYNNGELKVSRKLVIENQK